jgi:hypothetical protein
MRLRVGMDTDDLVERLLTIAGEIMEDVSPVAIIRGEQPKTDRALQVACAGAALGAIGLAAHALLAAGAMRSRM